MRSLVQRVVCSSAAAVVAAYSAIAGNNSFSSVHRISLQLDVATIEKLRAAPRANVAVVVAEGAQRWTNVVVHLKGAAGSFRPIDEKPSFTLMFSNADFHGLTKLHLNNSVEDPAFANELLGSEAFRSAGIPAPRVAHAVVMLNAKRLGIYVLKEGFTTEFVAKNFTNVHGQIFEPGPGHDVDESLDAKLAPNSGATLKALARAIREPDANLRWSALQQTLDVEAFARFLALEVLLAHRDGYALARNNFRIFQPESGRAVFLPAGMDQLFGRAPSMIEPHMSGAVARAFIETRQGHAAYRQELAALCASVLNVNRLHARIDEIGSALKPVCTQTEIQAWRDAASELKGDITKRNGDMTKQIRELQTRR